MKRLTTKEILVQSFHELAQRKNVDKITISDIVENCEYSTATFYRHFKDKYDLIAWDYSKQMETILFEEKNWKDTISKGLQYYQSNKEYIKNLILHTSGYESFLGYMSDINDSYIQAYVKKKSGLETLDSNLSMAIHFYCHGTVAMICDWLVGKIKATDSELANVFESCVPLSLQEFLL